MRPILVILLAAVLVPVVGVPARADPQTLVVGVNGPYHSIQEAVDAAQPGDTVFVEAGVYQEEVAITTPGITLQGADREATILDGGGVLGNGVTVTADDVTIKSMSARDYSSNGFVFTRVQRFHMTDLHAIDNGEYGLYAVHSQHGVIEHSYANGHGDSGFYIGETVACDCDVQFNEAWENMLGYSGTANSYVRIHDNNFYHNRAGILMSVLPNEAGVDVCPDPTGAPPAPGDACPGATPYGTQVRSSIYDNWIHDNNNHTRATGLFATVHPPVGEGIVISGGWMNDVYGNRIENNHLWGVGIFWLTTPPRGNYVHDNAISGSRYGIWWDEQGEDHCFARNAINDVQVVSDPDPLPTCPGLAGDLPCPSEVYNLAACRANDPLLAGPGTASKDAFLGLRALFDLDPEQDVPTQEQIEAQSPV